MIKKSEKKPLYIIITAIAFAALMLINVFSLKVSTIVLMLAAAVAGLIAYLIKRRVGEEAKK